MGIFERRNGRPFPDLFGQWIKRYVPLFYANWIASLGSLLAIVAALLLVLALFLHIYQIVADRPSNPYVDLVGFMILPMMLIGGLFLVVIGNWIRHRREKKYGPESVAIQVGGPEFRRKLVLMGALAGLGLVVLSTFSYEAYHFTDSTEFCMKVCHTVMKPEGVAYERSPHANVACVKCHIGPGADWFVRAKISGIRQVFAVIGDTYQRPIPTPVENLRPARETCEECHQPEKFHGSRLVLKEHFEPDRANTPSVTALLIKVGGLPQPGLPASGVHWHVDPRNQVRYRATDAKRQEIVEVVQLTPEGEIRYLKDGTEAGDEAGEWRVMDCIDCHNRPTHIFERPDDAIDRALLAGELDREVPWLRREAGVVLREISPDPRTVERISLRLEEIYQERHPEDLAALRAALPKTAAVLTEILERNVFPEMAITWGTYGSNLTHMDLDGEFAPVGCFRCHDDEHAAADGRTISQDCDQCHYLMAERETNLKALPAYVPDFLSPGD